MLARLPADADINRLQAVLLQKRIVEHHLLGAGSCELRAKPRQKRLVRRVVLPEREYASIFQAARQPRKPLTAIEIGM